MRHALALVFVVAGGLAACRETPREPLTCSCTPANRSLVKNHDQAAPMDGDALLALLRRHQRDVQHGRNKRDLKVDDDELRLAVANFCQPCGAWVGDSLRIDEMFPLAQLDEATHAVCLGLVRRDGTTVYGDARPRACR